MALILILDDDFAIVRALEEIVSKLGHDTIVCSDGLDGIDLLELRRPEAVMADWQMGEISGIDVLEAAMMKVPLARRILVTASPTAEDVKTALRDETIQVLIEKPWSLVDIKAALRGL